jgi:hypothetical protein
MVVFYPMSAILTLFCNLLLNPLNPQAQEDLELLSTVPDLINAMHTNRLATSEAFQMNLLENFIAELARLGNCAVREAMHDRNLTSS